MKGKSTFCRFLYCQFKLIGYARPILWLYIHESLFHFLIANLDIIRFDITTVIFVFDMQIRCHHFWIIFYCKLKFSHGFFFYFWTGHIRKYILSYCIIFFIFFILVYRSGYQIYRFTKIQFNIFLLNKVFEICIANLKMRLALRYLPKGLMLLVCFFWCCFEL